MSDPHRPHEDDVFSAVLNLEDQYHAEGYAAGVTDGARGGRIEGRTFGLEKGFERFAELGRLGGRAGVWNARVRWESERGGGNGSKDGEVVRLAPLKGSERLKRQVDRLVELTDPQSLSTVNDEESVNAFDDRLREAKAKATLIAKTVGERELDAPDRVVQSGGVATKAKASGGAGKEMEDFAGLPVGKRKE